MRRLSSSNTSALTIVLALVAAVVAASVAAPVAAAERFTGGAGYVYGGLYSGDFWNHGAVVDQAGVWSGRRMTFAGTFHDLTEEPGATEHLLEQGWSARATPFANVQVHASAARVASGEFDGAIARFRDSVRTWLARGEGRSLIFAPFQEMNGAWTPWGCDPGGFKAAYRRVVDSFRSAGVDETQVRWAYAPNGWSDPSCPGSPRLADYYPGDDVVDLIAISAYNYGPKGYYGWEAPHQVFGPYLDELRSFAPHKPYMVAQTGTAPVGGDRDAWLRDAWAFLAADANVVGLVYFNVDKAAAGGNEYDWRIWFGHDGVPGLREAMTAPHTAYAWPLASWFRPGPLRVGPVERVAGPTRIETAVALSQRTFSAADHVMVAPQSSYAHALLASPLAARLGGPVLLTQADAVHDRTLDELRRLRASRVTLVGSTADLSGAVEERLRREGFTVDRVEGGDVFQVAAAIARRLGGTNAYVVEGRNPDPRRGWPDAISVSALAAHQQRPILFVERDVLPDATRAAVRDLALERVTIVGGPVAVSDAVAEAIANEGVRVSRAWGESRYDTSLAVAGLSLQAGMDATRTWLATGEAFPDALTAGPAVAADRGVLLLVHGQVIEGSLQVREWLRTRRFARVRLVGGPVAISAHVEGEAYGLVSD